MIEIKARTKKITKDGKEWYAVSVNRSYIEGASDKFRDKLNDAYYNVHIAKGSKLQLPENPGKYIDILVDEKDCFYSKRPGKFPTIVVRNAVSIDNN